MADTVVKVDSNTVQITSVNNVPIKTLQDQLAQATLMLTDFNGQSVKQVEQMNTQIAQRKAQLQTNIDRLQNLVNQATA